MKSVNELALDLIFDQRVRLSRALSKNKPMFVKVGIETPASAQANHILRCMAAERNNPEAQQVLLEQVIRASRVALRQQAAKQASASRAARAARVVAIPGGGSSCPEPVVKIEDAPPVPLSTD